MNWRVDELDALEVGIDVRLCDLPNDAAVPCIGEEHVDGEEVAFRKEDHVIAVRRQGRGDVQASPADIRGHERHAVVDRPAGLLEERVVGLPQRAVPARDGGVGLHADHPGKRDRWAAGGP
jgi:hypothetical protein